MAHIGDFVPKSGVFHEPGVVVKKNNDGTVIIDTEPVEIHKYHRYLDTTGLSKSDKNKLNSILDEIYKNDDDMEKLNDLQKEMDLLKKDPENVHIVKYLENQQSVLIRKAKDLPRTYIQDESKITK